MRRRFIAFAIALAAVPLPATATETAAARIEPRLPARRVAEAFAGPAATAASLARAQAGLLTAPRAAGGSDLSVLDRRIDQDVYYKSIAVAGDLDGDGASDVLTTEYPMPSFDLDQYPLDYPPANLVARSGATGAQLWRVASHNYEEHLYLYFGVFGTPARVGGHDRPLIVTMDVTSPGGVRSNVIRQTLSVLDGRDGSVVWSREFAGAAIGDTGLTYPVTYAGLVYRIDAIGGTAGDDLLVSLLSQGETHGLVLSGDDGEIVGGVTAAAAQAQSLPWIVPATVPGSGDAALLAVSTPAAGVVASLHPVQAGAPYWTVTIPISANDTINGWTLRPPVTLAADRYQIDAYVWRSRSSLVAVVHDGAIAWSSTVTEITDLAGDADGDGTDDVLLIASGTDGFALSALSGIDGSQIWARLVAIEPVPGGSSYLGLCVPCSGDVDGDGAAEAFVLSIRTSATTKEWRTRAIRGSTGNDLWRTPPLGAYAEFPFPAGADMTGDGGSEVAGVKVLPGDPQQIRVGVTVNRGSDFGFLWSQTAIKPAVSGSYSIRVTLLPVRLNGGWGIFVSLNEYSEERRPDGTLALRFDPSVHMFAAGGTLWNA